MIRSTISQKNFVKHLFIFCFTILFLALSQPVHAQFEAPEFEKVTNAERAQFQERFKDINWSGRGLYEDTALDDRQANELRARLQAAFGDPTQKLEDLINRDDFRPGKAIQFEYWFIIDGEIPMMVLDWDGPFGSGLTFAGASKYIDMMPQIKRAFSQELMSVEDLGNYQDYFYSPERGQWFEVSYKDGNYQTKEIESPEGMTIDY